MKKLMVMFLLVGGVGLGLLFASRFFWGGDEDTWICADGQWVKHGNPDKVMPQTGCGVTPTIILGGDKDEHGCIGSAGYMWCEPRNKCLRIWEETCYSSVDQEIQYLLARKYQKPVSDVKATVTKRDGNYVKGSVSFGENGGGAFLARKAGNMWEVVFDGNGSIDCNKMRQEYGFPDTILKPNFCD